MSSAKHFRDGLVTLRLDLEQTHRVVARCRFRLAALVYYCEREVEQLQASADVRAVCSQFDVNYAIAEFLRRLVHFGAVLTLEK